mmetsp:Transcript_35609/g.40441  ORF Transcript_35609/g.40441 Transcript_35609/m.40441 type:complete len:347 (-) Transcript_35609:52-1092(-)
MEQTKINIHKPLIDSQAEDRDYGPDSSHQDDAESEILSMSKTIDKNFVRGIIFQILSSIFVFIMFFCVKMSNSINGISNPQILTVRGYIMMTIGLMISKVEKVDFSCLSEYKHRLGARMTLGFFSVALNHISLQVLTLSMSATLFNVNPIIGVFLAAIIFKERISTMQIFALFLAFLGIIVLVLPGEDNSFNGYMMLPLIAGCTRALALMCVRSCKGIHWIIPVMALSLPLCVLCPIYLWLSGEYVPFTWETLSYVVVGGFTGTLSSIFMTKSLQVAEMGLNLPISYLSVILTFLADEIWFDVGIEWNQIWGSLIIFSGVLCVTYVKYQHSQEEKTKLRKQASVSY